MEYKSFSGAQIKASEDGTIEAIVSVFGNVDLAGEKILHGAFKNTLTKKLPKGVWMHDWTIPIAKTISAEEIAAGDSRLPDSLKDLGGLLIKGQFNLNTTRGKDAYEDLKFGTVDEFSIGYRVLDSDLINGVKELKEIELFEWSPVLVGANRATTMMSLKGFDEHVLTLDNEVKLLYDRILSRIDMREKEGRVLSSSNTNALSGYADDLIKIGKGIKELVVNAQPQKDIRREQLILKMKMKKLYKELT